MTRLGQTSGDLEPVTPHDLVQPDPEPWREPVNGETLLDELRALFERYLVLPEWASVVLALWSVHTFAFEAADHFPILAVLSPEKRCGKTTLLRLLEAVCRRPILTGNLTKATVYRVVELWHPTLLIDEADTFLETEGVGGILNAGHLRDGRAIRNVGDEHIPKGFSAWGPKAIAAIGKLKDTLIDRSIVIRLRRRAPKDREVEHLSHGAAEAHQEYRSYALRWVRDNLDGLRNAAPVTPSELNDREADNWRPLFAIADQCGLQWSQMSRLAAIHLSSIETEIPEPSVGQMLLADLRDLFKKRSARCLSTQEIVGYLVTLDDRPWKAWEGLSPEAAGRRLAKVLKPYGVRSEKIRVGDSTSMGYVWDGALESAVAAYVDGSPEQPEQPERTPGVPDVPDVPDGLGGDPANGGIG